MNTEDYIKEGIKQLPNTSYYQELEDLKKMIKSFIKEVKATLDRLWTNVKGLTIG